MRQRLLDQAVTTLSATESNSSMDYFSFHYTGVMQPEIRALDTIDDKSLDQLVFSTLGNLPPAFETDRLHTVLGAAAQILALRDRNLARELLQPAMQDRGWLFMGRSQSLDRVETLISVARIDPEWAVEVVEQLYQSDLQDDLSD